MGHEITFTTVRKSLRFPFPLRLYLEHLSKHCEPPFGQKRTGLRLGTVTGQRTENFVASFNFHDVDMDNYPLPWVGLCPPKDIQVLIPSPCECDLRWKAGLCRESS